MPLQEPNKWQKLRHSSGKHCVFVVKTGQCPRSQSMLFLRVCWPNSPCTVLHSRTHDLQYSGEQNQTKTNKKNQVCVHGFGEVNWNGDIQFISVSISHRKKLAKQLKSLRVIVEGGRCFTEILVDNLACTCTPQCGPISPENHHYHTYIALRKIRTCSFINLDTVAVHFAFLYISLKRKILP